MRYTARNHISKPLSTTIRAGSLLTKKLKYEAGELGRNIWLLTAFGGLTAVANGLLSPVLPPYFSHIGLTGEDVGSLNAISGFSTAVSLIPAAYLADAKGRKKMLIAAFVLITPASLLIYSGQRGLLAIAFLILGVANATASVSVTPLFADSAGDGLKMTKAFSVYQVTSLICTSIGTLSILPLLSLTGILGGTLEIYKLSLLAATSLFMLAALPLLGVKEKESRQDRFNLTFSETTLKLTGVSALLSFGSGIAVQNIGYYFVRKFSVEAAELGVLGFAQNILIAGATMLAPLLSFHLGLLLAVVCLQLISVPLFVITAISPSFTLAAAFFTIRSTLVNMSNPLISTLQMSLVESDERTRISMLLTLATTATTALGALIGGRLLDIWIDAPLYVAALVYTLQTLVLYITFKRLVPEGRKPGTR